MEDEVELVCQYQFKKSAIQFSYTAHFPHSNVLHAEHIAVMIYAVTLLYKLCIHLNKLCFVYQYLMFYFCRFLSASLYFSKRGAY